MPEIEPTSFAGVLALKRDCSVGTRTWWTSVSSVACFVDVCTDMTRFHSEELDGAENFDSMISKSPRRHSVN